MQKIWINALVKAHRLSKHFRVQAEHEDILKPFYLKTADKYVDKYMKIEERLGL